MLVAAAVYLLIALWLLYPAWLDSSAVVGAWAHPDMISNHWLYLWIRDQVLLGGSILHNDRYYFPVGDAPWLAGNGSDAIPFVLVGAWCPWPVSMTVWCGLAIVLNGLSGRALARAVGASGRGALVGGALLAASPYVALEMSDGRFAQMPLYWMAFFLAAWIRLLRRPRWDLGLLAGLLFSAAALEYWYYGLWAAWAGGLLWLQRRSLRALPVFLPVTLAVTVPVLLVFLSHWTAIPGVEHEAFPHRGAVATALPACFPFWGGSGPVGQMVLPTALMVLAGVGVRGGLGRPMVRGLLAVAALFYLLALGPYLVAPDGTSSGIPAPFLAVYAPLEVLRRFWWPYRHVAVLTIALVPLAALGAEQVLARAGRRAPVVLVLLLALLPVDLQARGGHPWVATSRFEPPPVYGELARLPGSVILELPLSPELGRQQASLSYQWIHGKTLVNGHAMWVDRVRPEAWDRWVAANGFLADLQRLERGTLHGTMRLRRRDIDDLRHQGVRYLTLNSEYFPGRLNALMATYHAVLGAAFGKPVLWRERQLFVWDLDRFTGARSVEFHPVALPDGVRCLDGDSMPPVPTVSLGWTNLERTVPPVLTRSEAELLFLSGAADDAWPDVRAAGDDGPVPGEGREHTR